jgi:hypothetical protein
MKKIAVGDLGEFWYGDYKEPFEQLEGGIPGHPVGVVLKADDGKLLCAFCGGVHDNLAAHAFRMHGLTARAYKDEVGLLRKSALVSERVRQGMIARALRRRAAGEMSDLASPRNAELRTRPRPVNVGPANVQHKAEFLNRTGRCYRQVLAVAATVARENGRVSRNLMARHGIGDGTIQRYFGSFEGLAKAVGTGHRPRWTRLDDRALLAAFRSLAEDLGRTPSASDLNRYGLPPAGTYRNHFGGLQETARRAGLQPNVPVPLAGELELTILSAYAVHPSVKEVARREHIDVSRVLKVLHRYGFPFGRGHRDPAERRAWAAEMARRVGDWPAGQDVAA